MSPHVSRSLLHLLLLLALALLCASPSGAAPVPPASSASLPPAAPVQLASAGQPEAVNVELVGHLGGTANAVALQGDYAYVGFGPELAVVDVRDPANMQRLGYLTFNGSVGDVFVAGNYAYVALGSEMAIVDVSEPTAPTLTALFDSPLGEWGNYIIQVIVANGYAYLADGDSGLRILDVTDPAAPVEVGAYTAIDGLQALAISGTVAYLGTSYLLDTACEFHVVDLADPTAPQPLAVLDISPLDAKYIYNIVVSDQKAYLSGSGGLLIFDVTDPSAPIQLGSFPVETSIWRPLSVNALALAEPDPQGHLLAYLGTSQKGLLVVDVTDPVTPQAMVFAQSATYLNGLAVGNGMVLAAAGSNGLLAYDLSESNNRLAVVGSYDSPGSAERLDMVDQIAYLADGDSGLRILDVTDPAAPVEIGAYTPEVVWDVAVGSLNAAGRRYAYLIVGDHDGLRLVDVTDPAQPIPVGYYNTFPNTAYRVAVYDDGLPGEAYVYLTEGIYKDGLRILDVSDPAQPTSSGYWSSSGYSRIDNLVIGQPDSSGRLYAFLANYLGLYVLDVTEPANPFQAASLNLFSLHSVALVGHWLYGVYDYNDSFYVVDVADPSQPVQIGSAELSGGQLAVDGRYALAGDRFSLSVADVSDPARPVVFANLELAEPVNDLTVSDGYGYIANSSSGLTIVAYADLNPLEFAGGFNSAPTAGGLAVEDQTLYLTNRHWDTRVQNLVGLQMIDGTDPARLQLLGSALVNQGWDIAVQGGHAYIGGESLSVFDITLPGSLVQLASFPRFSWSHLAVASSIVYLPSAGWLYLIDISDPVHPFEAGAWQGEDYFIRDVAVGANRAFLAFSQLGLKVLDVSNPVQPVEIGAFLAPGSSVLSVEIGDLITKPYVFLGEEGGVRILDVSNPAQPVQTSLWSDPTAYITAMKLGAPDPYGRLYLYLLDAYTGLRVLDITDPALPFEAGYYNASLGYFGDIVLADDLVYVTGEYGLYALRFTGFAISGRVTHANGLPYSGVTISAGPDQSALSQADGLYTLMGLPPLPQMVSPELPGYAFQPPSRQVALPPNAYGQGFTVLPLPVAATVYTATAVTLTFSDTQGLPTTLLFPTDTVTATTSVTVTPGLAAAGPDWAFTGHAFDLSASPGDSTFTFQQPLILTIAYSDADVRVVSAEDQLALYWWDAVAGDWLDALQTCDPSTTYSRDPEANTLSLPLCRAGKYALFGPTNALLLPVVRGE